MKKTPCATILLFTLTAVTLCAELPDRLSELFSPADARQLERQGELSSIFKENESPTFIPRLALGRRVQEALGELKPMFGVEYCVVHKTVKPLDGEASVQGLYNTLLKISSLKGLEYYSASRKRMRELFIEAYCVPAAENRTRLPDPVNRGPVPPYRLIHTFQHDSTFGENFYSVTYRYADGAFLMTMSNANKIWYGIIPLIDPDNLAYFIIVYPAGDYILFYSLVCVKGANPFGIMESKTESFYNRIKALDNWFRAQSGLF